MKRYIVGFGAVLAPCVLWFVQGCAAQHTSGPMCRISAEPSGLPGWEMEIERCGESSERWIRLVQVKGTRHTYWVGPVYTEIEARTAACAILSDTCDEYPGE